MHADIKNKGVFARTESDHPTHSLTNPLPGSAASPDSSLSAAFRSALGGKPDAAHLPASPLKTGQEIARQAKSSRPGAPHKGAPRKAHIGPRSGHK